MQIKWREKERENEKSRRRSVRILMTPPLLPADERDHNQRGMNLINEQPRGEPRRKGPLSLRATLIWIVLKVERRVRRLPKLAAAENQIEN